MRAVRVWRSVLGVDNTEIESVELEAEPGGGGEVLVARLPACSRRDRCGRCGRRRAGYDRGEGLRRWRRVDLGTRVVYLEADAPRLRCREHGKDERGVAA